MGKWNMDNGNLKWENGIWNMDNGKLKGKMEYGIWIMGN